MKFSTDGFHDSCEDGEVKAKVQGLGKHAQFEGLGMYYGYSNKIILFNPHMSAKGIISTLQHYCILQM